MLPCNVIGCVREIVKENGYPYSPLCEHHRMQEDLDPCSLRSYRKAIAEVHKSPELNEEERVKYFRLIYVMARITELIDTFYALEEGVGFKCIKCDALRTTWKHEPGCFVGRLDGLMFYANDNTQLGGNL